MHAPFRGSVQYTPQRQKCRLRVVPYLELPRTSEYPIFSWTLGAYVETPNVQNAVWGTLSRYTVTQQDFFPNVSIWRLGN